MRAALPRGWGLKPLPNQAGMRVAIRQCLRVGPRAGALLENFGVVPETYYQPTRQDVMEGYRGLLVRAAVYQGQVDGAWRAARQQVRSANQ